MFTSPMSKKLDQTQDVPETPNNAITLIRMQLLVTSKPVRVS